MKEKTKKKKEIRRTSLDPLLRLRCEEEKRWDCADRWDRKRRGEKCQSQTVRMFLQTQNTQAADAKMVDERKVVAVAVDADAGAVAAALVVGTRVVAKRLDFVGSCGFRSQNPFP